VPIVCCLASGDTLVARLRGAGIPVEVIGLRKRSASGAGVVRHLLATLSRLWRFVAVVRRHRPAVVHGMLFWGYVFGTVAARATGVPRIVASRRSLAHFKDGKPSYVWLERLVNRWTDVFVANSQAVRNEVLRLEHVAPARVCVIYNGIDVAGYLRQPDPALRESLGIGATMPVATVVANFIHYKGHLVFLKAWQGVVARHADAVALLIGDGPLRDEIVRDISAAGLDRSIRVLGHRHDVPDLLAISDVCVHPSFEEGFSNAVLEALAAARPVVATAVGGTPEIVIPGRTGWLVPPRDSAALAAAILEVLADPIAAAARGAAGRQLVAERCDRQTAIARYQQVYLGLGSHSPCAESLDA
jgi:glycosyltransferase involved in cell wall biosynthesis